MVPEIPGNEGVVERFIKSKGFSAELLRFAKPVRTVADVERMGIPSESVVKTLIVKAGAEFVAVLVRGDAKLDYKKIARVLGVKNVRMATPQEVERVTGVSIGAVSPLMPFVEEVKVVVDRDVYAVDEAYGGGGSVKALVLFNPKEFVEKTGAVVADVSRDGE